MATGSGLGAFNPHSGVITSSGLSSAMSGLVSASSIYPASYAYTTGAFTTSGTISSLYKSIVTEYEDKPKKARVDRSPSGFLRDIKGLQYKIREMKGNA